MSDLSLTLNPVVTNKIETGASPDKSSVPVLQSTENLNSDSKVLELNPKKEVVETNKEKTLDILTDSHSMGSDTSSKVGKVNVSEDETLSVKFDKTSPKKTSPFSKGEYVDGSSKSLNVQEAFVLNLKTKGKYVDCGGGGDCLFKAFEVGKECRSKPACESTDVTQYSPNHTQSRLETTNFISTDQHLKDFVSDKYGNTGSYVSDMGKLGTWATEIEIEGLAKKYGISIILHKPGINGEDITEKYPKSLDIDTTNNPPIHIAHVNDNHFVYLHINSGPELKPGDVQVTNAPPVKKEPEKVKVEDSVSKPLSGSDFSKMRNESWVNDVKKNFTNLDKPISGYISKIEDTNGDLKNLYAELKDLVTGKTSESTKGYIKTKISDITKLLNEKLDATKDPSKLNTIINTIEDIKKLTVNPRDKEVIDTVKEMKAHYDTVDDSKIEKEKLNSTSVKIKGKLFNEQKDIGKLLDAEVTRTLKHYQQIINDPKYKDFKPAIEKANLFPKLAEEMSIVLAPALKNEFAGGRALNLSEELPNIVKFANKFDPKNENDIEKLKKFISKANSASRPPCSSPVIKDFCENVYNTLKTLESGDEKVRGEGIKALNDMVSPKGNFLTEIKPKMVKEFPLMAEITKKGPLSSEKLYKEYMSKINITKLMQDYPTVEANIKTTGNNFIRNLDILCSRMKDDLGDIKETFFGKSDKKIELTGLTATDNDPHKGGQHGWFLKLKVDGVEKKVVYKPRDVKIDSGLVGSGGAFDKFNTMIGELNKSDGGNRPLLNVYKFMPKEDYGYAEFVTSSPNDHVLSNEQEAKDLYYQYGMMMGLTRMFLMGDQHQGNVLFHDKKPTLIDTEMSFNPGVENHKNPGQQIMINKQFGDFDEKSTNYSIEGYGTDKFGINIQTPSHKTDNYLYDVSKNLHSDEKLSSYYKEEIEKGMKDFLKIMAEPENQKTIIEHIDKMDDVDCRFHVRDTPTQLSRLRAHFYEGETAIKGLNSKVETLEDFKNVYKNNPVVKALVDSELKASDKPNLAVVVEMALQTLNGDVPYFTQKAGGTDILGTGGKPLKFDSQLIIDIANFIEDQGGEINENNGKSESYFGTVTPKSIMEKNIRNIGTEEGNKIFNDVVEFSVSKKPDKEQRGFEGTRGKALLEKIKESEKEGKLNIDDETLRLIKTAHKKV